MKKLFILSVFLLMSGCSLFNFLGLGPGTDSNGSVPSFNNSAVLGTYTLSEVGSATGTSTFNITISTGSSDVQILIANFYGVFTGNVIGTMTDAYSFTLARQEPDSDGFFVVGSGTYSNTTLYMSYTVSDERDPINIVSDVVTSTGTKN